MSAESGEPLSIADLVSMSSTYLLLHSSTKTLEEIVRGTYVELNRQEPSRIARVFTSIRVGAELRARLLHVLESDTARVTEEFLVAGSGSHFPLNPVATFALILRIAKDFRNEVSPELLVLRYGSETLTTLFSVVANSLGDPGLAGYFINKVGQRSLDEVVARVTISKSAAKHLQFLKDLESQINQKFAPLPHI